MIPDSHASEQDLRKTLAKMQEQIARYQHSEQKIRHVQSQLDEQLDTFNRIHQYAQMGFQADGPQQLAEVISEGIVDIFQLEMGAVLAFDLSGEVLHVQGSCGFGQPLQNVPVQDDCNVKHALWSEGASRHKAVCLSRVEPGSTWAALGFCCVIYMPLVNNRKEVEGLLLGAVSADSKAYYDFEPEQLRGAFMVYCQQMNGIYNNFEALRQARQAGEVKDRFMANLSHEMRTPMNAIIGMLQIAQRSADSQEIDHCIKQATVSSKHLLALINDVLDISKIEEGKLELSMDAFDLQALIESLLGSVKQSANEKKQTLAVNLDGLPATRFVGDSMRLSQVLLNLLSNAVKFTPAGGTIALDVVEEATNKNSALLNFSVSDTGIGIEKKALEKIFMPFEQADNSISRSYGGTGLGLAISNRIVEHMGGSITADSTPGQGSCFTFSIWLERAECDDDTDGAAAVQDTPDFTGRRILLVDDIAINREIVIAMLAGTGAKLDQAANGEEAYNKVMQSPRGYYDLVLMDIQMPVLDGYAASQMIRASAHPDAESLLIVAMTANAFKEDVQMSLNAKMNGHIIKPVEYDVLISTLQKLFS